MIAFRVVTVWAIIVAASIAIKMGAILVHVVAAMCDNKVSGWIFGRNAFKLGRDAVQILVLWSVLSHCAGFNPAGVPVTSEAGSITLAPESTEKDVFDFNAHTLGALLGVFNGAFTPI